MYTHVHTYSPASGGPSPWDGDGLSLSLYIYGYICVEIRIGHGRNFSLATICSHRLRPQFHKDTSSKHSASSFGMPATGISISSTSTPLLPATCLWGLCPEVQGYIHWSSTLVHDLAGFVTFCFLLISFPAKFHMWHEPFGEYMSG